MEGRLTSGDDMRRRMRTGGIAVLAVLALLAGGCSSDDGTGAAGGSDDATEDTGGGPAGNPAAEEAQERAEAFLEDPTELRDLEPLSATPEEGKRIVWLRCSQPSCQVIGDNVVAAAEELGWEVDTIDFSNTEPESVIVAMNQALDSDPDGIALSGIPSDRIEEPLARAQEAGIPVISAAVVEEVGGIDGNGIIGLMGGPNSYETGASAVVDWVIADSGGDANIAVFTVDDFPIIRFEAEAVQAHVEEACPDCTVTVVNQTTADIGTNTPGSVVSTIQENPDIDYVYFGFGDLSRGVTPALLEAGLDAKVVGLAPTEENYQRIIDGEEAAWASWSTPLVGWDIVDGFARFYNGDDLDVIDDRAMTIQLFTEEHPPESESPIFPANYKDLYDEIWQVG